MSADPKLTPQAERDALAGEYVLGVLDEQAAAAAERRMARDADFARAVASWQRHLHEIDLSAAAQPVPADLWPGIEAAINRGETPGAAQAPDAWREGFLARLWRSVSFWRFGALAGVAAALVLAVGLSVAVRKAEQRPVLVAVLMTADNQAGAIVNVSAEGVAEISLLKGFEIPPGKAIEIWTLWDRTVGPRSIGLTHANQTLKLNIRDLPRQPGQLFEMTLEAATGSPTGKPTGPVLTKGNATTPL